MDFTINYIGEVETIVSAFIGVINKGKKKLFEKRFFRFNMKFIEKIH